MINSFGYPDIHLSKTQKPVQDYTGAITSKGIATFGRGRVEGTWNWIKDKYDYYFDKDTNYKSVDDKGIDYKGCRQSDAVLAQYGQKVAKDLNTQSGCYTGVKHALLSAGVLKDYGEMPAGDAKNSIAFFDKNPAHFTKVDVKSVDDLKKLPAGHIVVYKNSEKNRSGHIAITNGKGQEYSDHTGNMQWNKEHGGEFHVYKLSDKWKYNPQTKKLTHPQPFRQETKANATLPEIKPTGVNRNDCPNTVSSP